jgi:hypothetical protein
LVVETSRLRGIPLGRLFFSACDESTEGEQSGDLQKIDKVLNGSIVVIAVCTCLKPQNEP